MTKSEKETIVVIGGGFAGLNFVKHIDKERFNVVLIDRNNFHSFPPLFYQLASSGLDPASISFPFRREMRMRRARGTDFHMGEVRMIDTDRQIVVTNYEQIHYDRLVIAAGTTNNFFGDPTLKNRVFTLKSTSEALRIRNEVLDRLERAAITQDPVARKRMLSFVVIGAGPTGVEIAGALGEMKRYVIKREYPTIDPGEVSIVLLEGSDRVLRTMSEKSSVEALAALESLMVEVRLNTLMNTYNDNQLTLSNGEVISSETVIWTAGITGEPFLFSGEFVPERGPGGRFITDDHCIVKGTNNIYAIGDIGWFSSEQWPKGLPQLAQVAIQESKYLAKCINEDSYDVPFVYNDKGSMATIGRGRAVVDMKKVSFAGFFAWFIWMFIHLISLLGMRNKITVLVNWMLAYFTYNTSLRLLIHTNKYPLRGRWDDGD